MSCNVSVTYNIWDKESSSGFEIGVGPHRLKKEEEFGRSSAKVELFFPRYLSRRNLKKSLISENAMWQGKSLIFRRIRDGDF